MYLDHLAEVVSKYPTVMRYPSEANRGFVMAMCAVLDKMLGKLFEAQLKGDKETRNLMFGEMGPLGSFAAKARLGYLLDYYNKLMLDELLAVGRIRNWLAHDPSMNSLDHPKLTDLHKKLVFFDLVLAKKTERPVEAKEAIAKASGFGWNESERHFHFLFTVCILIAIIAKRIAMPFADAFHDDEASTG